METFLKSWTVNKSENPQKKAALLNILKNLNNADVEAMLKGQ